MENIQEEIFKRWESTGLLEGLEYLQLKENIANNLENVRNRIQHSISNKFLEETTNLIFPCIRRLFQKTSKYDSIKILYHFDTQIRDSYDDLIWFCYKENTLNGKKLNAEAEFLLNYCNSLLNSEIEYLLVNQ